MSYCTLIENLPENKEVLHKAYHDLQYGFLIHEKYYFLVGLILKINQAELSCETVLKKLENFREACYDFDLKNMPTL